MCHTRELAFQISKEYERFSKFLPAVKVSPYLYIHMNNLEGRGPKMLVLFNSFAVLCLCQNSGHVALAEVFMTQPFETVLHIYT